MQLVRYLILGIFSITTINGMCNCTPTHHPTESPTHTPTSINTTHPTLSPVHYTAQSQIIPTTGMSQNTATGVIVGCVALTVFAILYSIIKFKCQCFSNIKKETISNIDRI